MCRETSTHLHQVFILSEEQRKQRVIARNGENHVIPPILSVFRVVVVVLPYAPNEQHHWDNDVEDGLLMNVPSKHET